MEKRVDITDTVVEPNMLDRGSKTLVTNTPQHREKKQMFDAEMMLATKQIRQAFFNDTSCGKLILSKLDEEIANMQQSLLTATDLHTIGVFQGRIRGIMLAQIVINGMRPPLSDTEAQEQNKPKEVKSWI